MVSITNLRKSIMDHKSFNCMNLVVTSKQEEIVNSYNQQIISICSVYNQDNIGDRESIKLSLAYNMVSYYAHQEAFYDHYRVIAKAMSEEAKKNQILTSYVEMIKDEITGCKVGNFKVISKIRTGENVILNLTLDLEIPKEYFVRDSKTI